MYVERNLEGQTFCAQHLVCCQAGYNNNTKNGNKEREIFLRDKKRNFFFFTSAGKSWPCPTPAQSIPPYPGLSAIFCAVHSYPSQFFFASLIFSAK
jgi:hypothetical protein